MDPVTFERVPLKKAELEMLFKVLMNDEHPVSRVLDETGPFNRGQLRAAVLSATRNFEEYIASASA